MSLTDYEAMRQKWIAERLAAQTNLANSAMEHDRLRAAGAAIAYKLAHWRHRADEVCGRIYEDLT